MNKRIVRNTIKIVAFLLIFTFLFTIFYNVLRFKYSKGIEKFYDLPENSVDVLFVGSSHCYRNINPAIFYENEGITAYNLGSASAMIWNSYYYLEEALKTQKPKVVYLECYKTYITGEYSDTAVAIKAVSGMKISKTYFDDIKASVSESEDLIDYYLMFPWFHSRYDEITEADILENYGNEYYDSFLGYFPINKPQKYKMSNTLNEVTEKEPLSDKVTEYLDKIVEITEENDIELVFVITPFCKNATKLQPYYNSLAEYADEKEITLINGNLMYSELGLNRKKDFGKGNHLCDSGATKITNYLLDFTSENYDLEDHRGDEYYSRWEANVAYMNNGVEEDETLVE